MSTLLAAVDPPQGVVADRVAAVEVPDAVHPHLSRHHDLQQHADRTGNSDVPTERQGRTPAWQIEQRLEADAPVPWVVHRGDCHAGRGPHRAADDRQALAVLARDDAMVCPVCQPDRVLLPRR
ncbi:DUF6233 domain-containing protein [Streptomyces sp. NBC_01262]|uniref:DUF6233 domain-containing protein n=1 Tax=Streptomyces sp. NBC_01262 TaxID=2903803 RepID=UPI003FCC3504